MITVIFTRRHHVGSLALRAALWSPWSHCAILDGDEVVEAAAGHGVQVRPLADFLKDASRWVAVQVPCPDPQAVIAAARSQVGRPYDWLGVVGIGFRRHWQDSRRWFCSELIAWAFDRAGHPLVRMRAWRITPRDLYLPIWR